MYPQAPFVVGVTGGIASGKTLVTSLLADLGAITFSADEAARAVVSPGSDVVAAIGLAFGSEYIQPDGRLDRARLGARVFASDPDRATLNQIAHPHILRLLRAQIESARDDLPTERILVVEVPLLFEAHLEEWFDVIVVVSAPPDVQAERLHRRDGLELAAARARLAAQWPLAEKVARAGYVISNTRDKSDVVREVAELWQSLWGRRRFGAS